MMWIILWLVLAFIAGAIIGANEGYRMGKHDMKTHLFEIYEMNPKA